MDKKVIKLSVSVIMLKHKMNKPKIQFVRLSFHCRKRQEPVWRETTEVLLLGFIAIGCRHTSKIIVQSYFLFSNCP